MYSARVVGCGFYWKKRSDDDNRWAGCEMRVVVESNAGKHILFTRLPFP
jgi:hypothetical protein